MMLSERIYESTPELDAAELRWWRKFADIEEKYCWVQPARVRRFLRGRYARRIISTAPPGSRIAELGCGTGWLSILLAQLGASEVVGIDFSPEQIERAKQGASTAGLSGRVQFIVGDVGHIADRLGRLDLIVVHALLHHLATAEINGVLASVHRALKPGGHLIVWEPLQYTCGDASRTLGRWERRLVWLSNLPMRGTRLGLRRVGEKERAVRSLLAERNVGTPPRGPSPKEIPFRPGEIEALVAPLFEIARSWRCMTLTVKVAEELLLMRLSHPCLASLLFWPVLWIARVAESRLLREGFPGGSWVFEMFDCVAK